MIRINGTYPSDSIPGAGLSATDDSLFIVSLVLPHSVLSQSISKTWFRQGNVPAFSKRQNLLQTKKRTSLGMNFSTYGYSKPAQSSRVTEEEKQCIKTGQPFRLWGAPWCSMMLHDAPRAALSKAVISFWKYLDPPSWIQNPKPSSDFSQCEGLQLNRELWQTSNSQMRKCNSCFMTGTYPTDTSRLQHLGAYSSSWPEGNLHKSPQRLKNTYI